MRKIKNTISKKILVCDLKREHAAVKQAVNAAVLRVLDSGWYILGRELESFEKEFAGYAGSRYAVGVASGTEALQIALLARGIGDGDEVITAVNTAIPTAMAIAATGARPVFVDVDPETANMNAAVLAKACTRRTKAVIPVHLYGNPCDMPRIMAFARRRGLVVIEDCAQAQGASIGAKMVGTFGDMGAFSFYPTKNLGAYGDGGMVVTNVKDLAKRAALLRNYGQSSRYVCEIEGINSRLDELQAAILRVKLKGLDRGNMRRRAVAVLYRRLLGDVAEVRLPSCDDAGRRQVYHLFVIRCRERDCLKAYLADRGVETQIHYPIPLHLQEAFCGLGYRKADFPVAAKLAGEILSLPVFPEMTDKEVVRICSLIRAFYGHTL